MKISSSPIGACLSSPPISFEGADVQHIANHGQFVAILNVAAMLASHLSWITLRHELHTAAVSSAALCGRAIFRGPFSNVLNAFNPADLAGCTERRSKGVRLITWQRPRKPIDGNLDGFGQHRMGSRHGAYRRCSCRLLPKNEYSARVDIGYVPVL